MKKSLIKSAAVAIVATLTISFTTANANTKPTFIYGDTENTKTVCTLNEDGKTLTPRLKYEYQYNNEGELIEKKAYRWDMHNMNWQPAYQITINYGEAATIYNYAEWNNREETFNNNKKRQIYYMNSNEYLVAYIVNM